MKRVKSIFLWCGGAGFLIGGFAQKMFELRPKNTARKENPNENGSSLEENCRHSLRTWEICT